ncbi:hypothetical protein HOLleu_42622 [Holothuria leucospilota]|uniref:Uncharacterized protein n=1 Tax=Holothuria leucospilota TaxID=206669 RepID=A0A9Q0YCI5_HOLLE|nr:hypothetical protein HOLleu_42622 [Holothuria leucospilota]
MGKKAIAEYEFDVQDCVAYMSDVGLTPLSLTVKDDFANEVRMQWVTPTEGSRDIHVSSIDEVLFNKDKHLIPDIPYQELTYICSTLPSLKRVRQRACELNNLFDIQELADEQGVYEPLQKKLEADSDKRI